MSEWILQDNLSRLAENESDRISAACWLEMKRLATVPHVFGPSETGVRGKVFEVRLIKI